MTNHVSKPIQIIPIDSIGPVERGADVARLITAAVDAQNDSFVDDDVLVVCSKIIAKAEDRVVRLAEVTPSALATRFAQDSGKDPRLLEVVLRESKRIVRMNRGVLIVETHHGYVCANAGVDQSNVDGGDSVCMLPTDPDASARHLRQAIEQFCSVQLAVLISDSFGRPWRLGQLDVAIGIAGIEPVEDFGGRTDLKGFTLRDTQHATVDAITAAAGLCFRKMSGIAACIVRGYSYVRAQASHASGLIRDAESDLFR